MKLVKHIKHQNVFSIFLVFVYINIIIKLTLLLVEVMDLQL